MTIDPNEYDLSELRAGGLSDQLGYGHDGEYNESSDRARRGAKEQFTAGQYRELFLLENTGLDGGLSKPYLDELPDSFGSEILVFEWLEFLLEQVGYKETMETLRYYESIDWLSSSIESILQEYASGCPVSEEHKKESLGKDDHLLSLLYIARLTQLGQE